MIDGNAQVAVNVLTDNSYLEKRPGNTLLATILPGYPVQYVGEWYAPNGADYLIAQASQTVYETNFSGALVALSTVAAGYNLTTVPQFSVLYLADGFRPLWFWNDASTGTVKDAASGNVAPICSVIDAKDSRIWCALTAEGFTEEGDVSSGGGKSTVLVSSVGGAGYWAVAADVGLVDDTPNRFDFNPDDGDEVACLAHTPWGEFVGKRHSSYLVKGNGNLSYNLLLLDPKIGCVDNRSVQMVYGVLEWLAVDGVYGYDGSGTPRLLTRELDPLMQTIRETTFSQGTWLTALQPDWAAGLQSTTTANLPPQGPWDFNTVPGEIFPSSGTLYDDNTSPLLQTCTTNLNPDSGLPWTCGVGFASDTLVNIDTTSVPLSVGYAHVAPSSGGVQVWISSFPAGNYTTLYTTWTVSSTPQGVAACGAVGVEGDNDTAHSGSTYFYTAAPSSGSIPSPNGWNFGTWTFSWYPWVNATSPSYGNTCNPSSVGGPNPICVEYDFIANKEVAGNASWSGYGLDVNDGSSWTANLFKSVAGVKNPLGSASFTPGTGSPGAAISTFTITRLPGGYMTVAINGVVSIYAQDNTGIAEQATYTEFFLNGLALPAASQVGLNCLYNTHLNGYGAGSITSRVFDTGTVVPLAGVLSSSYTAPSDGAATIAFEVRDSTSPNNDLWSSFTPVADAQLATLPLRYWQYEALFNTTAASETVQLGSVELDAVTTGYYYSRVDFVGNLITSWRQFAVDEGAPGTYNYAVREATYAFPAANTTIPWIAQAANQNVNLAVSTPTYAQFRLDSTVLASNPLGASAAEPLLSVALAWDQGADVPVASATLERRYMLCVAISSAATAPDTCLLRQKTGKWVEWSNGGTISALGLYNQSMVAASGDESSAVWSILQPQVYNDAGNPIAMTWVSEDFTDGLPYNNKTIFGAMVDATPAQVSSVTYSYDVNKSSGYVNTTFSLDDGQAVDPALPVNVSQYGDINMWLAPLDGYNVGKYIRVMFRDDNLNSYPRINSYMLFSRDEPWMVPTP